MKKVQLSLLILFSISINLLAQAPYGSRSPIEGASRVSGATYSSVVTRAESWYASNPNDTDEMNGALEFDRWQAFWQYRVTHDDSVPGYFRYAFQAAQTQAQNPFVCSNVNGSNWTCLGPNFPTNVGGYNKSGRMECIATYPDLSNSGDIVFAGSLHGGLWKSTNFNSTSPTWVNVTDYLHLPGLGVNNIVVDPAINSSGNHTIWFSIYQMILISMNCKFLTHPFKLNLLS